MKKQINLPAAGRKLSLNKKTISNLSSSEMSRMRGGRTAAQVTCGECNPCPTWEKNCTNKNSCPGHHTCYTC